MKRISVQKKHLLLTLVALLMMVLIILFSIISASTAEAKTNEPRKTPSVPYSVVMPTMSYVGLTAQSDGTVIGDQQALTTLWSSFAEHTVDSPLPAVNRQEIVVVYFSTKQKEGSSYSVFIGYPVVAALTSYVTIDSKEAVLLDMPAADYWALRVDGTITGGVIKAWNELFGLYPDCVQNTAMEIYSLRNNSYSVENITIYLKKM